jgi:hypothetical protein
MQNKNQSAPSSPIYSDQNKQHFPITTTTPPNITNNFTISLKKYMRLVQIHNSTKSRSSSLTDQTTTAATFLSSNMNITLSQPPFPSNPPTTPKALADLTHNDCTFIKTTKRPSHSHKPQRQLLLKNPNGSSI